MILTEEIIQARKEKIAEEEARRKEGAIKSGRGKEIITVEELKLKKEQEERERFIKEGERQALINKHREQRAARKMFYVPQQKSEKQIKKEEKIKRWEEGKKKERERQAAKALEKALEKDRLKWEKRAQERKLVYKKLPSNPFLK